MNIDLDKIKAAGMKTRQLVVRHKRPILAALYFAAHFVQGIREDIAVSARVLQDPKPCRKKATKRKRISR